MTAILSSIVSFLFCISVSGADTSMQLSGSGESAGECFHLRADKLELYCDSTSLWVLDHENKELYIEHPVEQLSSIMRLEPSSMEVSGSVREEGYEISYSISQIKESPAENSEGLFIPDIEALGKDWVITDLR